MQLLLLKMLMGLPLLVLSDGRFEPGRLLLFIPLLIRFSDLLVSQAFDEEELRVCEA